MVSLKVSADKRYLVDAKGQPFLVVGDTAWSLIADLTESDIKRYLDDRKQRGFNALIVNLIENKFATDPPRNRAGSAPLTKPGDFATPNPTYFDFAHHVLAMANERGMAIWLCPAYLGWGGGDEGFFSQIQAGGAKKLEAYGRYIGKRFADLPNIVWMVGGDYAMPPEHRWAAIDLATAIRAGGARQLFTAHGGQQSAVDCVGEQPWLNLNNTYSYEKELFRVLRQDYARTPTRPFVLIESIYENEHNAPPEQIRRQAYWSLLCGACGQFFGNNPIWHFDGPGLFAVKDTWREELANVGSRDMSHLRSAFASRAWHRLVPDSKLVTAGTGDGTSTITAGVTSDGKLAMLYIPSTGRDARELTVDAGRLSGKISASWFNPTNGKSTPTASTPIPNTGTHTFSTPGDNGTGTNDWLLILEASA